MVLVGRVLTGEKGLEFQPAIQCVFKYFILSTLIRNKLNPEKAR